MEIGAVRRRVAVAVAVGALLVPPGAWSASAASSATVVLYADHTWTASGAISDAGTWVREGALHGSFPSPVEGAFNLHIDLAGGQGNLAMRFLLEFNQSQQQLLCNIDNGSGAYAQTRGAGTYTETHPAAGPVITCSVAISGQ